MLKIPSEKKKKKISRFSLNLLPVLNSGLIFIFFPLLSTLILPTGIRSHLSMKSEQIPHSMTLEIEESGMTLTRGEAVRTMPNNFGSYDLNNLQNNLIDIKTEYPEIKVINLIPKTDLPYIDLERIMKVAEIFDIHFTGLKKSDEKN